MDTGPVFVRETMEIAERETAGTLHDRLMAASARVAVKTLAELTTTTPTPQPVEGITWAPKIEKADGEVSLTDDAMTIDRRIRAMSPWPGGWTRLEGGVLKLRGVRPVAGEGAVGQVLSMSPLIVACGSGALELVTVQAAGRKAVSGVDYANGARLSVGETL